MICFLKNKYYKNFLNYNQKTINILKGGLEMDIEEIKRNLEAIYLDYYDGVYTDRQLKTMLLNLYKKCNVSSSQWSELILDAQWRYATEQDYENKIKQLEQENREDNE